MTIKVKKPLLADAIANNKSVDAKLDAINQDDNSSSNEDSSNSNADTESNIVSDTIKKPKKADYQIALDDSTIEALKQRHNLEERKSKASFFWKTSNHKKLRNIGIDTDIAVERFLEKWCEEGLERLEKDFQKEIRKFLKNNS